MSAGQFTESAAGFGTLRQLARRERPLERCELCSLGLRPDHPHLVELAERKLLCTCEACAILFSGQGVKFKRVPRRVLSLPAFHLSDAEWNDLMVPINMAFFFRSSPEDRIVALYPSPAGATESLLALESWNDIVARNPILITALNSVIGYEKGAAIAKQAYKEGRPILDVAKENTKLHADELKELLDPAGLTTGGIKGPGGSGG